MNGYCDYARTTTPGYSTDTCHTEDVAKTEIEMISFPKFKSSVNDVHTVNLNFSGLSGVVTLVGW